MIKRAVLRCSFYPYYWPREPDCGINRRAAFLKAPGGEEFNCGRGFRKDTAVGI